MECSGEISSSLHTVTNEEIVTNIKIDREDKTKRLAWVGKGCAKLKPKQSLQKQGLQCKTYIYFLNNMHHRLFKQFLMDRSSFLKAVYKL